jgi:hypothetical protein
MKDKKKTTYILLGVLVVLVLIAYMMSDKGEKTTSYKKPVEQFFKIDSASVDKVELERNGKKITLVKSGIEWRLSEPVDYPVQSNFVQLLVSDLKNYKISSIVSTNLDNKNFYGFNDTGTIKITVYQNGASSGSFLIGKEAMGAAQSYIKNVDGNEIFLADNIVVNNFMRTLGDWRSKYIMSIPKPTVKAVEFISGKETFKVVKDSTGKYYIGKDTVNYTAWEGILNLLNDFNTQGFKDSVIGPDMKPSNTVKVDWNKSTEINFYPVASDTNKYILKVSDIHQLFEVDKGFANNLLKSRSDILPKK